MKPPFYKAVDPTFLYVLALTERVQAGEQLNPDEERAKICARLDAAETKLAQQGQKQEWELAKYAIASWIDELLAADLWDSAPLEFELFKTAKRSHEFYNRAEAAMSLPRKDALECFYITVVLGFRGMYSSHEALMEEREFLDFQPPDSLEAWAKRVGGVIQIANDVPKQSGLPRSVPGARLREGKFKCIGAWAMGVLLAAAAFLAWRYTLT